jgi:DNA-binding transcriptional ArsR family regulator
MQEESKQDYGTLVAKKSERLVTALYLVTDLMNDNEPIKHGLRKNAVALLSSMNALAQLDVKDRVIEFKMSLKAVTEIISLLHVSVTTGIVSEMNGQLLMDGFRSLQLVLEKKQPIFTKEMLSVDDDELDNGHGFSSAVSSTSYDVMTPLSLARLHDNNQDLRRSEESRKQAQIVARLEARERKGQSVASPFVMDKKNESAPQETVLKKTEEKITPSAHSMIMEHKVKVEPALASSFQMRKTGRREQILALFVKGVDVSIKDIAARIRGCSEKTIQRELNALLYDNVIERIGEKRWSRYVLR